MVFNISKIIRDVHIAIDENRDNQQLLGSDDIDTLALEQVVRSKVVEAARRVLTTAPVHLLDGGERFGDSVYWRDQGSGWTFLPDGFLRLVIFKMSDWARAVYEPITAADPRYAMQSSRYKGVRGNPQKPVVAIVSRAEGRILEFYSSRDETATVEQAVCMGIPKIDEDGGLEIPERCYRPMVYVAASLVLATMGQGELSTLMSELSKQLLV